jgi:hypothetical protein
MTKILIPPCLPPACRQAGGAGIPLFQEERNVLVIDNLVIGIYLELACLPQAGNLVIGYLKRFYSQEV